MERIKDFLLGLIETVSSKISVWAWNKRWNKGNRKNNIKYFKIGRYHIIDNDDLENFLIKFKKYVQSKGIIYYSDEKKKYILGISKNDFKDSSTNLNLI